MAHQVIELRLIAIGGTADCTCCGKLVAWHLKAGELERWADLRCPCCGAGLDVHAESIVTEVAINQEKALLS